MFVGIVLDFDVGDELLWCIDDKIVFSFFRKVFVNLKFCVIKVNVFFCDFVLIFNVWLNKFM